MEILTKNLDICATAGQNMLPAGGLNGHILGGVHDGEQIFLKAHEMSHFPMHARGVSHILSRDYTYLVSFL